MDKPSKTQCPAEGTWYNKSNGAITGNVLSATHTFQPINFADNQQKAINDKSKCTETGLLANHLL
ncbi:MAG: hypothetical protein JWR61_5062 [Ferruginibacter sp.]|nr:hypothetical protein [Ferruginibacter sp.]